MRALLLSAIATGVATVIVNNVQNRYKQSVQQSGKNDAIEVNTEAMTEEQVQLLSNELESML